MAALTGLMILVCKPPQNPTHDRRNFEQLSVQTNTRPKGLGTFMLNLLQSLFTSDLSKDLFATLLAQDFKDWFN